MAKLNLTVYKQLDSLRELFAGEAAAVEIINSYGEDGIDLECVAERLVQAYPWALELIAEVV